MRGVIKKIMAKNSYFDLNNKQASDNVKNSLYGLCKEIAVETGGECGNTIEDLIKKFHNNKGTGIIDHLKNDLGFDVYDYGENMHQVCQFLKLMYRYEKDKSENQGAFQITKVLLRPRVENLKSPYYKTSTRYGENIECLMKELEGAIGEEAEKRKSILLQRNQRWNDILCRIMCLSYEEEATKEENIEASKNELLIVRDFLKEKIYDQLEKSEKHIPKDNIFMAFYTLLIEHMMLCEEEDRVKSYEAIEKYDANDEGYIKTFVKWENYFIYKKLQGKVLEKLIEDQTYVFSEDNDKTTAVDFKYLIFGNKEVLDKDDILGLRLAQKYNSVLIKWIKEQKPSDIPEDWLQLSWFIAIVQEIIYCSKNHVKVRNDAYGVKVKEKTMISTLKNSESADAKHIQEWMIRIENRYSADIGSEELQSIERKIEIIHQKIRRWALQHHDLEDLLFVDNALVHTAERMIVPRAVAENKLKLLGKKLKETGVINQVHYYKTVGGYNLGRELQLDASLMEKIVHMISNDMKQFDKTKFFVKGYKKIVEVQGSLYEGVFKEEFTYLLMYSLCRNGTVCITYFRQMEKNEIIAKYKSYGLGKLGISD